MTWLIGDLFNLIGCLLEPATIPTQLYTAVIYTITTVVLSWHAVYYGYICKWWKARKAKSTPKKQHEDGASINRLRQRENTKTEPVNVSESIADSAELAKKKDADWEKFSTGNTASSLPIPSISPGRETSIGRNLYYMSARSLASGHTPTPGSYLASPFRGSGRSSPTFTLNQACVDDEGLLTDLVSANNKNSKTTLRSVAATMFFVGGLNFFHLLNVHNTTMVFDSTKVERASVVLTGRRILQGASSLTARDLMIQEQSRSPVGTYLGWVMAIIYMGGRFPQICLNIHRGTVEGLNPLMFLFAIIGNTTYVASIVVRTLEWRKLKPNLPWLVDAAACVFLDCFILAQFAYYKTRRSDDQEDCSNGDYVAIKPPGTTN